MRADTLYELCEKTRTAPCAGQPSRHNRAHHHNGLQKDRKDIERRGDRSLVASSYRSDRASDPPIAVVDKASRFPFSHALHIG